MSDDTDLDDAVRDADQLRLLVVLAFVYAAFTVIIGAVVLVGMLNAFSQGRGSDLTTVVIFARQAAMLAAAVALPFLLRSGGSRTLCAVAAFLVAWDAPAGTVLGVLTLLVLARRSVARAFEHADALRDGRTLDPDDVRRDMIRRAARRHVRERREASEAADADGGDASPPVA